MRYPLTIREQVRGLRGAGWSVKRLAQALQLREELVRSWCQSPQADAPQVFAVRRETGPAAAAPRPPEAVQLRVGALTITIEMARA